MSAQVSSPNTAASTPPAVRAWSGLLRAHAATTRLLSADLGAAHGLSLNDSEALHLLSQAPGRRLRRVDLARDLILTASGITRLLEGLEDAGLVARAPCSEDLRITYAVLTPAGAATLRRASCGHVGSIRALLEEHLTPDEIDQLATLLGKLPGVTLPDDGWSADEDAGCG